MLLSSLRYLNAGYLSLCPPLELHFWGDSPLLGKALKIVLEGLSGDPNSFQRFGASDSEKPTIYMAKLVVLHPRLGEKNDYKKTKAAKLSKKTHLRE